MSASRSEDFVEGEECELCCENITKKNKKITCQYDKCKIICSLCFCKNILDKSLAPVCIWCKKAISFPFIVNNTTEKQLKTFMDKRSDLLLAIEKNKLSELQEQAAIIIKQNNLLKRFLEIKKSILYDLDYEFACIKKKLKDVYKSLFISGSSHYTGYSTRIYCLNVMECDKAMRRIYNSCCICDVKNNDNNMYNCTYCEKNVCDICIHLVKKGNNGCCFFCHSEYEIVEEPKQKKRKIERDSDELKIEIYNVITEKIQINKKYFDICDELYTIRYGSKFLNNKPIISGSTESKKPRSQFIKKCPDNDCRGFLSTQWKCAICENFFCSECHGKKDKLHICNENEKATISALKTETKPCPKCEMPISRISGCSQVWTPCCKIAFDWNTGKIDTGNIHSPEYFAYIKRTIGAVPRERINNPCGELSAETFCRLKLEKEQLFTILNYYQLKLHVNTITLFKLPHEEIDHSDLGLRYLTSEIDEESWKCILSRREKKRDKNSHIYNILHTFIMVMNELLLFLLQDVGDDILLEEKYTQFIDTTNNLIQFTNEETTKINSVYKSKDNQYIIKLYE